MSPAGPLPCVVTEIFAPSLIPRDGGVTVIFTCPTLAGFAWQMMPPPAERTTGSLDVTITFPPCGEVDKPLPKDGVAPMTAPSVTVRFLTSSEMSLTAVAPDGLVLFKIPVGLPGITGSCPDSRTESAAIVTFGVGALPLPAAWMMAPPVIVSGPTVTMMSPARPPPRLFPKMAARSLIVSEDEGAKSVKPLRFSLNDVVLVIPLETPEMVIGPVALMVTPLAV